ncbi:hypothetical protein OIU84_014329 [Salix udensis]|uniref:Uncharacterized protein n=1 Tax=Salix udensis TaxID=889485 RepID=A0AAD6JC88_9ROSI|nr:hypothetical protein OIU84_014329 [Salix udensis]
MWNSGGQEMSSRASLSHNWKHANLQSWMISKNSPNHNYLLSLLISKENHGRRKSDLQLSYFQVMKKIHLHLQLQTSEDNYCQN